MADNIITAVFGATRETKVRPRYRYDQGQVLIVRGVKNLPDFYEVHFANEGSTADATPLISTTDGVIIPDTYFQSGATIYAYIYVHDEATDGTTVYKVTIPIINRARPANVEPTPEQEDIIAQAIVALNENVGRSEEAAEQAEESAETALSAADGAAQAERNAGAYADRAEAAQRAAEMAEDNAGTSATQAQEAAQNAAGSASDAYAYLELALDAANRANTQAARAEQASNTARGYATQAETAKQGAETAKTDAQTARTQAQGYWQAAEAAATRAGSAATRAETAQSAAEAAQTAAEAAETDTQTYAGQAYQSATNAGQSAASAAQTLTQVQNEGASQIAAIDAEGQRVIDSIPSDYTQMEQDVTDLKSQTNALGLSVVNGMMSVTFDE